MKQEHLEVLPVEAGNFKAVEDWLMQMAKKGYLLTETAWDFWYFAEAPPSEVRYRLDAVADVRAESPKPERIEAYEAAGWQYVTTHKGYYHILMTEDPWAEEPSLKRPLEETEPPDYNKEIKKNLLQLVLIIALIGMWVITYRHWESGYPAKFILGETFIIILAYSVLITMLLFEKVLDIVKLWKLRQNVDEGLLTNKNTEWSKKKKRFHTVILIGTLILSVIGIVRSVGIGGPVRQELAQGERGVFLALELLGDRSAEETEGDVFYYKHPLLRNRYEVRQWSVADADSPSTVLEVVFYDSRIQWLAEELFREFQKEDADLSFVSTPKEGFDEYLSAEDDELQTVLARIDSKVIRIYYNGSEKLSEKSDVLRQIMNGQRPQ